MFDGKEERKKERKKNNKIKIFMFDFLDCEEKSWDSGTTFDIRIAQGFSSIRVFATLHCVYLGAAPIP